MAQPKARKKLIRLIQKYLAGKASPEEEQFIKAYYESFDATAGDPSLQDEQEKELLGRDMKAAIWQQIDQAAQHKNSIPLYKRTWFRVSVAAAIVVLAFIPVYYYIVRTPAPKVIVQSKQQMSPVHDALPGGNKATLTLADGTLIDLDKAPEGELAKEAGSTVRKREDGVLEYRDAHSPLTTHYSPAFNTLTTPTGGQYYVTLPDGSRVWLNAASSLKYPTVFNGNERLVYLTGEAYFEITKNHDKPFRVHFIAPATDGGREGVIEVLGTHFNVNAYADETMIKTTLLEGQIREWANAGDVQEPTRSIILNPGQQAQLKNTVIGNGHIRVIDDVDTEEAIAWKNGLFYFDKVDIQAIMRQLERWYKVQVVFKGRIPARRFAGQVSRSANLSQVLKILEYSKVHFTIEGNVVTVLP